MNIPFVFTIYITFVVTEG